MKGPENWDEWRTEEAENIKKIDAFVNSGHSHHCACRLVWGDGECECSLYNHGYDPYSWTKKRKRPLPTHKVIFWGVKCYLNDETGDLWGVNRFHEMLIPVATWFHNAMSFMAEMFVPWWEQPGFRFGVLEDYTGKVKR